MYEVRIAPPVLADVGAWYLTVAASLSEAVAPFEGGGCVPGPVGASLALVALDRRLTARLTALSAVAHHIGVELEVIAATHRMFEGAE
jgi:MoxR-like ATPase